MGSFAWAGMWLRMLVGEVDVSLGHVRLMERPMRPLDTPLVHLAESWTHRWWFRVKYTTLRV